jgi:hypothetical protein
VLDISVRSILVGPAPEVEEIEPLLWGQQAIVLETLRIARDHMPERGRSLSPRQRNHIGERFHEHAIARTDP